MTLKPIIVTTESQNTFKADQEIASLLDIEEGSVVNGKVVMIYAGDTIFVKGKSLSPLNRMPENMQDQLMHVDIPIGEILRSNNLETRRDIVELEVLDGEPAFDGVPVLSRSYKVVYNNRTLMWINERFPIDNRWNLS
jgi:4-hydroxybenzoate synthetase (chorismate lyase)